MNKIKSLSAIQIVLWLAMALALLGSLRHVAWTFSSIDGNHYWGWVQAVAVDTGLIALTLAIARYKKLGRKPWLLWIGVVAFAIVSVYANLVYGISHDWKPSPVVLAAMPWIEQIPDYIMLVKMILLAATLPLLALYLADINGNNGRQAQEEAESAQVAKLKSEIEELKAVIRDQNKQVRAAQKETASVQAQMEAQAVADDATGYDRVVKWLELNGGHYQSQTQIANDEIVQLSRARVGQILREIEERQPELLGENGRGK